MKRYRIIGSYSSDRVTVNEAENYNEITVPLITDGEFNCFGMDHVLYVLRKINIFPNEKAFDLMALALLVYIADTRISRTEHGQDSWTREIFLELPVEFLPEWSRNIDRINRMLRFLTGDIWYISFSERTVVLDFSEGEKTDEYDAISLFSGGMDSLISTINLQEEGKSVLLAVHANESLVKNAQTSIVRRLDIQYPNTKHSLIDLWTSIPKNLIFEGGEENTTRSRSFLFIAFALFVASGTANIKELI